VVERILGADGVATLCFASVVTDRFLFMSAILDYSSVGNSSFLLTEVVRRYHPLHMERASAAFAKRFFLAKLEEQSLHDGVHLSELEKKMFLFSETTASDKMVTLAEEFAATCDDAEYEKKISDLLKAAFRRDKQVGEGVAAWKQSLKALTEEDFYGLVMVEQAGSPFSQRSVVGDIRVGVGAFLDLAPTAVVALAVGAPGFLLIFDPFQWV
jgi:hypothetical protein